MASPAIGLPKLRLNPLAKGLSLDPSIRICWNCKLHKWKQPDDQTSMQQCARCKMLDYCSKECQKEHWVKVHRKHCKYMAGLKILPQSLHDQATCLDCKDQAEAGMVNTSRPDNPVLGCPCSELSPPSLVRYDGTATAPLPFPLGEMSGKFITKLEATVVLMTRVLFKMSFINHIGWSINTDLSFQIVTVLRSIRSACWDMYTQAIPGPWLDSLLGRVTADGFMKMINQIEKIDQLLHQAKFIDENQFRPWDTFKILASFVVYCSLDLHSNISERVGLPEMTEDLLRIWVTSSMFNNTWDKVLETLAGRLVPYSTLVKIMCGGQLEKVCHGCLKRVTIQEVLPLSIQNVTRLSPIMTSKLSSLHKIEGPVLIFGTVCASLCKSPQCVEKQLKQLILDNMGFAFKYNKIGSESTLFRCDYCAQPGSGRDHRCSKCFTVVYCGVDCRDQDWGVHKLVCREGEELRKRKTGKTGRRMEEKEVYNEEMKKIVESVCAQL